MTLSRPASYFLEVLTTTTMIIYSKKALDENAGDLRKVIAPGTGAFMFKDHKSGEKWTFVKNPNYWDPELPYVDAIEMLHTPQLTDRGTAVLTGQADMTWNASVDTWREGQNRKNDLTVALIPNPGAHTVHINNTKKPLDDKRVRRAISLAVSRQNIFKAYQDQEPIFLGRWMNAASPHSLTLEEIEKLPGYRADKTADLAEAKKLMADAGYADGFGPIELVSATAPWAAEIMAPAFAEELKRNLNITTNIRLVERGSADRGLQERHVRPAGRDAVLLAGHGLHPGLEPVLQDGRVAELVALQRPGVRQAAGRAEQHGRQRQAGRRVQAGMDMLDQDAPFFVTGFTAHSPMWRNNVKGLSLDKRVHVEWGRNETAWLDG